jgi:hypothetical protein
MRKLKPLFEVTQEMFAKKNSSQSLLKLLLLVLILITAGSSSAWATSGIKTRFLTAYPSAAGSRLATLPSAPNHCGACHFAFSSSDADTSNLNPYGDAMANNGTSSTEILAIGSLDSDGDGFSNNAEITGAGFTNIPTFSGLKPSNVSNVSGVTLSEINGFLVPVAATQSGSLQVTLGPAAAVTAGVQWNVDGGAWKNSAATVTSLSVGSHTVNYKAVTGWTAPVSESVSIANGTTTTISRSYTLDAECAIDDDCTDNLFCNGDETCANGACVDGTEPCSAEAPLCNEQTDTCEAAPDCAVDADCDDAVFCNGDESCSAGACVDGTEPCSAEAPVCNEDTDTCDAAPDCAVDADCDDDVFCNGDETCADGACVNGTEPCSAEAPVCNEQTDTCEAAPDCAVDADCDDDVFCNGDEACADGACVAGPGDPCESGETCNEDTDTCETLAWGTIQIDKATVKAGKSAGADSIQLSGSLNATEYDLNAAVAGGGTVIVSLTAEYIPGSGVIEYLFEIEAEDVNNGKYTSPKPADKAGPVTSLVIDTTKHTIKFFAGNADLTGLKCPITVRVEIEAYAAETELDEDIVNGPTKDCPLPLLMGVSDSLDVSDVKARKSTTPDSDSVSVSGTFTIEGLFETLLPVIIKIGTNTFTVPGDTFVEKNGAYSCKSADSGNGLVTATFDSVKAAYKISIKNATLADSGGAFSIDIFGNLLNASDSVPLP